MFNNRIDALRAMLAIWSGITHKTFMPDNTKSFGDFTKKYQPKDITDEQIEEADCCFNWDEIYKLLVDKDK